MKKFEPKSWNPEQKVQKAVMAMLREEGWFVKSTHGNMYSRGWPDLFACHRRYGPRWIEIKLPSGSKFTPAQLDDFPKFCAYGCGVYVLVAATKQEYQKLFKPYNWHHYL